MKKSVFTSFDINPEDLIRMKKWFNRMSRDKYYQFKGFYEGSLIGPELQYLSLTDENLAMVEKELQLLGISKAQENSLYLLEGKSWWLDQILFHQFEEECFLIEQADFTTPLYEFEVNLLPYDVEQGVMLETMPFPVYLTEDEFVCILACGLYKRCPDLTAVAAVNPALAKKIADQITMEWGLDGDANLIIMKQAIDEIRAYADFLESNSK